MHGPFKLNDIKNQMEMLPLFCVASFTIIEMEKKIYSTPYWIVGHNASLWG
jgi:hypothetical protein